MGKLAAVEAEKKVLAVYLGAQLFGIPIARIQGVLEAQTMTYVPLAPAMIKGVMNLRGRIVTAIDLRTRLAQGDGARDGGPGSGSQMSKISPDLPSMNVVIENEGELYSLLVDRVVEVLTLPCADISEPPLTMGASWRRVSSGVFQMKDKIMIILDPAALLAPDSD